MCIESVLVIRRGRALRNHFWDAKLVWTGSSKELSWVQVSNDIHVVAFFSRVVTRTGMRSTLGSPLHPPPPTQNFNIDIMMQYEIAW